jgi:hypothetical protein
VKDKWLFLSPPPTIPQTVASSIPSLAWTAEVREEKRRGEGGKEG